MRKLIFKEKTLDAVQHNMESILTKELTDDYLEESSLRDIARALSELNTQEEKMKVEINRYKIKIQRHINKELRR